MKNNTIINNLLKIKQEMDINAKKMIKQALVQLYASQAAVFVDKLFAFFFVRQETAKASALFIT